MNALLDGRKKHGFTLIELLVVIGVMLILMGLLVAGAVGFKRRAKREASKAITQMLATAVEMYCTEYRGAIPFTTPTDIGDLSASTDFVNTFWDSGNSRWKLEAANAALVYQLLLPRGKGPFLDANQKFLRWPRNDSNELVKITVNDINIMVAKDAFDEPLNIALVGVAKFKTEGKNYWGYITREGNQYSITTRSETKDFTEGDVTAENVILELTGLRIWSSGPDREPNTYDDIEPAVTGR